MASTDRTPHHAAGSIATAPDTSLTTYLDLMRAFLTGEITGVDFERRYIEHFGDDTVLRPDLTFRVLNDLFFAVDAYCADPSLRDDDDLDEDQLRARVRSALVALSP